MSEEPFYIGFEGSAEQAAMLRRVVGELAAEKGAAADGSMIVAEVDEIVAAGKWIDLFDSAAIERLTAEEHWPLEDILECLLHGEYQLLDVEYANGQGRLLYDPLAFPFGGTDPMKALVEVCGLRVTRDSFHDGFTEWKATGGA